MQTPMQTLKTHTLSLRALTSNRARKKNVYMDHIIDCSKLSRKIIDSTEERCRKPFQEEKGKHLNEQRPRESMINLEPIEILSETKGEKPG